MHAVLLIFHPFFWGGGLFFKFYFLIFCSTGCYLFVVAECMVYMRVCHVCCFLVQPDSSWQTATFQQVWWSSWKTVPDSNISVCFCRVEKQKTSCWQTTFQQACSVRLKSNSPVLLTDSNIPPSMFCQDEKQTPSLVEKWGHFSTHILSSWKTVPESYWQTAPFHQACSVKLKNKPS